MSVHRGRIVCQIISPSLSIHLKEGIQTAAGAERGALDGLYRLGRLHDGRHRSSDGGVLGVVDVQRDLEDWDATGAVETLPRFLPQGTTLG